MGVNESCPLGPCFQPFCGDIECSSRKGTLEESRGIEGQILENAIRKRFVGTAVKGPGATNGTESEKEHQ